RIGLCFSSDNPKLSFIPRPPIAFLAIFPYNKQRAAHSASCPYVDNGQQALRAALMLIKRTLQGFLHGTLVIRIS
ncbi:MAG: hypothetical protein NC091_13580, partial [Bacteroides sp.]|nr:hypothetical protein [Bacteroides sp.]